MGRASRDPYMKAANASLCRLWYRFTEIGEDDIRARYACIQKCIDHRAICLITFYDDDTMHDTYNHPCCHEALRPIVPNPITVNVFPSRLMVMVRCPFAAI